MADGGEEVEEAVGMVDFVGEEGLEGFLMTADEGCVLTLLATAILPGSHAQELAEAIVGKGVEMLLIATLLQLAGYGLEEGDKEAEGCLAALEPGVALVGQKLDYLGETGFLLTKETVCGGGSLF